MESDDRFEQSVDSEIRGIVKEWFIDPADDDYITARWCFDHGTDLNFLWLAVHSLEKYMKAALLLNGRPVRKVSHDIVVLYSKLGAIASGLLPENLTKPDDLELGGWLDEASEAFVTRLYRNGNEHNRYSVYGYARLREDLFKLDQMVYGIRRLCRRLDESAWPRYAHLPEVGGPNREGLRSGWLDWRLSLTGRLERIVDQKQLGDPEALEQLRHTALNLNFSFGSDYEHQDGRAGFAARNPVLERALLRPLEAGPGTVSFRVAQRVGDWVLRNVKVPADVRNAIRTPKRQGEKVERQQLGYCLIHRPHDEGGDEAFLVYLDGSRPRRIGSKGHEVDAFDPPIADDIDQYIREHWAGYNVEPSPPHLPGEYHPRIHRGNWPPGPVVTGDRDAWLAAGTSYAQLAQDLLRVFRAVEPAPRNTGAYGHEIRHLLILACTEVEAAWKGVLKANGYERGDTRPWNRGDYAKLCGPMRLQERRVELRHYPRLGEFAPFGTWGVQRSSSLPWYDTYNHVKHDRENALGSATLGTALDAMAALHVMLVAQFGPTALHDFDVPAAAQFEVVEFPTWTAHEKYFPAVGDWDPTPVACPDLTVS